MKVAAILGSPRKNGNTALLLGELLRGISENSDFKIDEIFLQENKISGCMGCDHCKREGFCIIKDDMQSIYPIVNEAEVLVLATPVYWWSMTGQMKIFIDRLYAQKSSDRRGKRVYLLMTYGGELPNSGPELVEKTFRDICDYTGMKLAGIYGVCTDEYIPVKENEKALREVYEIGKNMR